MTDPLCRATPRRGMAQCAADTAQRRRPHRAELQRRPREEQIHLPGPACTTRRREHGGEGGGVAPAGKVARGRRCDAERGARSASARLRETLGRRRARDTHRVQAAPPPPTGISPGSRAALLPAARPPPLRRRKVRGGGGKRRWDVSGRESMQTVMDEARMQDETVDALRVHSALPHCARLGWPTWPRPGGSARMRRCPRRGLQRGETVCAGARNHHSKRHEGMSGAPVCPWRLPAGAPSGPAAPAALSPPCATVFPGGIASTTERSASADD